MECYNNGRKVRAPVQVSSRVSCSEQERIEMPTKFSLFPKPSSGCSDLHLPVKTSRSPEFAPQHSPSNSFSSITSMTESMYSATSTALSSVDSQPYPMPLRISKRSERVSFSDLPREKIRHKCLEKPLPLAPSPSLEKFSFQARRPAPRPPVESWIDWSDDDSDDEIEVKPAPPRPARFSSMRLPKSCHSSYPSLGSIEEEILGMLQGVDVEDKRDSIHKLRDRHSKTKSFGDFVGKLRRSLTLSDHVVWRGDRGGTYFDCMI